LNSSKISIADRKRTADALPLDVAQFDHFNAAIQREIETACCESRRLDLAQIKLETNQRFDRARRAKA